LHTVTTANPRQTQGTDQNGVAIFDTHAKIVTINLHKAPENALISANHPKK
jgi:hypothetical protein